MVDTIQVSTNISRGDDNMAQKEMYPGMINSPETTITNNINESDTIIYVLDPARVPEPPNLMTLGTGTNAETVKVTEISGSAITVERGFQGIAKSWPAGTVIARNFTEYDYGALKDNIEDLDANKETPAGAQAKADAAEAAAKAYADQEVADLAGEGRMTETVKGNADALAAHLADNVTQVGGAHGLEIEEGIWTPFIQGHSVAGNHTYSIQTGKYYRINKLVNVTFIVGLDQLDPNMSGAIQIAGLPFPTAVSDFGATFSRVDNVVLAEGYTQITGYGYGTAIQLQPFGSDRASDFSKVSLRDTSYIRGSMTYYIN